MKDKHEKMEIVVQTEDGCSVSGVKEENESSLEEVNIDVKQTEETLSDNYFCRDCTKVYMNVNEFLVHRISVHHDDLVTETIKLDKDSNKITGVWPCDICGSKFYSKDNISTHLKSHQVCNEKETALSDNIFCKYCGFLFPKKQVLQHLQVVHRLIKNVELEETDADSFDCKICYRPFTRQSSLRNHLEKYHADGLEMVAEAENCDIVWKCIECNSLFAEELFLMQHYGDKHSKCPLDVEYLRILINKRLICHCGVINSNAMDAFVHDAYYHKEEENGNHPFECLACFEMFTEIKDLKKHLISFHWFVASNFDNECTFCFKEFSSNESLRIHLQDEHDIRFNQIPEEGKCVIEDKGVSNALDKAAREIKVESGGKFTCDSCGDRYEIEEKLQSHLNECKATHVCELCGKEYKSATHLKRHIIEYHNSISPIKCPLCPKVFPRKLNLHNHYKRRHLKQTKKFVCSYCGISLKGKVALRSHEDRLHRNIRNYKCTECPEAFTTRSILRKHAQRHLAERPMLQCQFCEKKFSTISGIERHVKTHGGVKEFVCDVETCGKSFYTKSELKRHIKFHTRDFKHVCPVCNHKFMTPGELKKHSTKHTGERPFKCHLCSCAYSRRDDKVKHLKRVHNLKVKRVYGKPLRKYSDDNNENVDTIVVDEEASTEVTADNDIVYANIGIVQ